MATVTIQFGIDFVHVVQARRHLQRVGITPVLTLDWVGPDAKPAHRCTIYTSNPDAVIDVLLKSAFKRMLVPNAEGAIIVEDWA
jgi:hypothetical protein